MLATIGLTSAPNTSARGQPAIPTSMMHGPSGMRRVADGSGRGGQGRGRWCVAHQRSRVTETPTGAVAGADGVDHADGVGGRQAVADGGVDGTQWPNDGDDGCVGQVDPNDAWSGRTTVGAGMAGDGGAGGGRCVQVLNGGDDRHKWGEWRAGGSRGRRRTASGAGRRAVQGWPATTGRVAKRRNVCVGGAADRKTNSTRARGALDLLTVSFPRAWAAPTFLSLFATHPPARNGSFFIF
jgi:hypothetical protein